MQELVSISSNNLSSNFCVLINLGPRLSNSNSLLERDFVWSVTWDVVIKGILLDIRILCFFQNPQGEYYVSIGCFLVTMRIFLLDVSCS